MCPGELHKLKSVILYIMDFIGLFWFLRYVIAYVMCILWFPRQKNMITRIAIFSENGLLGELPSLGEPLGLDITPEKFSHLILQRYSEAKSAIISLENPKISIGIIIPNISRRVWFNTHAITPRIPRCMGIPEFSSRAIGMDGFVELQRLWFEE